VNRTGSVHRDVRNDAALHEIDQHRCNAGLYDVAAEHHDDTALEAMRLDHRCCYRLEISGYENVGECTEKCGERRVVAGRRCKFFGANLVGPPLDWNRANL
jgi:hypothetical protein